jgi:thiol-disulfide isomerase/thioredoxin
MKHLKRISGLTFFVAWLSLITTVANAAQHRPPTFHGHLRSFTELQPIEAAPLTPMYTARGGVTNLRRYRGKVVLLNVWATWCAPCVYELPALDRLQAVTDEAGIAVLAVSIDVEGMTKVAPFAARLDLKHLTVLTDPTGRIVDRLNIREGLPWTFIIDRQGRVRGYLMGAADWDSADGRALLNYYAGLK